ncbi:MAG TPA: cytidylate kinase-like family protein [Pirellulales bacterium]|nr:cytidylate kinase-like family protein [Pirellulales bacterium]
MSTLASSLRHQRETSVLVEHQIQSWLMRQQAQQRPQPCRNPAACGHFIAISREAGAGGEQIGRAVSEELGWRVFDRELLALVAKAASCSTADVELIDETGMRWVAELFNHWIDRAPVSHEKYLICLSAVLRAALRQENAVIVGRGAHFLLPRHQGLVVRIIAPKPFRIEQVQRMRGMDARQAREWVEQTDRERRDFVAQHFHHDVRHMHLYDLVINVEKVGLEGAGRQIAQAAREVFLRHPADTEA